MMSCREILCKLLDKANLRIDNVQLDCLEFGKLYILIKGRLLTKVVGEKWNPIVLPLDLFQNDKNNKALFELAADRTKCESLLGNTLNLSESTLERILLAMMESGAQAVFDTYESRAMRESLFMWIDHLQRGFLKRAFPTELKDLKLKTLEMADRMESMQRKIVIVDRAYSSIEELLIHLDMT